MSDKQSPHRLGFFAMAASAVAVSILWGVACECRACFSLACWSRRASGLTLGWTCAATTFAPLIVFALVMGLCSGGWTSLYSAIIKSLVGMLSRSQVYLAHSILLEFTHDPRSSAFQRTTPVSPRTSSRPSPSRAGSARSSARRSRPRSSPTRSAAPRRKRATASRTASTAASSCSLAWRWGWGLGWRRSSGSCPRPRSVSLDFAFPASTET